MPISTKGTALALVEESTEGTPVEPSAATDFTAVQPGLAFTYNFEELTNEERLNSLAPAATSKGTETPNLSDAHYWRGSGTEGQAPDWNLIPKSAFGTEDVQSTERTTTSGSTTTVVELAAGGSDYTNVRPLLLKDGTNGRSVRWVESVSTNSLTLNFALANAPASGVDCGKFVAWAPLNTGLSPVLSAWLFQGDTAAGVLQLGSGMRVTNLNVAIEAGQFINMSWTADGIAGYANPMTVTSSNKFLDFTSDNGTFEISIEEKTYKDPYDVAEALESAMNDADTAETFTVTYSGSANSATGKFTIATSTSAVLSLLWSTGTHGSGGTDTHIGTLLGFDDTADDTGATTYTGDNALDFSTDRFTLTPSYDSQGPLVAKSNSAFIGTQTDNYCIDLSTCTINMDLERSPNPSICAESGISGSVIIGRNTTVEFSGEVKNYEVERFHQFHKNDTVRFQYIGGEKSGGNWTEGTVMTAYGRTMKVSSFELVSEDDKLYVNGTLTAFATGSAGEFFMAQL